jgi:hypothetical protein
MKKLFKRILDWHVRRWAAVARFKQIKRESRGKPPEMVLQELEDMKHMWK